MSKEKAQLNINIDPELLVSLKAEAIKEGKTLTAFVTERLVIAEAKQSNLPLEGRLKRIESFLNLDSAEVKQGQSIGRIFTDEGAEEYGEVAKAEFEYHMRKKGLDPKTALKELAEHLKNYPHSNPELVFQILLGTHKLTGLEMTIAYRFGSCAMRSALNDWTNSPLEDLNEAFLNAVITKSLA
ncbi:hypothetical protein [Prochlorococcus sp. MIT 1341]|uniref:hypothetical protein n=1 Tax=Prochlorococcus sp. MIT 1341 TaxID=3096221 RepID=UPI002A7583B4|nr:hypothetical protein [Prochlorococcus sp. MIT 1341]